jgi:hypothetical protein
MASAGTVSATIREAAASAVADGVSTAASTSTDNTVTYNPANPTVTVEQAPGQDDPTNVSPIHFVVTFSADVVDFATGDVTVNGSAQPTTAIVVPAYDPGHSRKFDVYVSGMIRSGTVTAVVRAGKAHDTSNNPNLRSTSVDNVVTYQQIVGGKVFGTGVNELPYESITLIDDERLLFNQAQFSRVSGAIQQVDDFTSQREFFTRSLVKSNLLLTTDDEALQLAEGVVVKYSQPHTLLTEMVLNPAGNDELYKYALQLDIGQSIRVRVRPPGITVGTYTEYIVCIQGVEHHVTRGLLSIIWQLSTVGIVQP